MNSNSLHFEEEHEVKESVSTLGSWQEEGEGNCGGDIACLLSDIPTNTRSCSKYIAHSGTVSQKEEYALEMLK